MTEETGLSSGAAVALAETLSLQLLLSVLLKNLEIKSPGLAQAVSEDFDKLLSSVIEGSSDRASVAAKIRKDKDMMLLSALKVRPPEGS